MVKKVSIPLSALFTNVGQIEGLPPNPRLIKDEKFEVLKKSLTGRCNKRIHHSIRWKHTAPKILREEWRK